ncbi:MAG TPA: YhcH/YjgK/YiaL family protein [Puia sp.]|nr:YhcH/YjgK/YiaL family protein [Puia sp.]
MITSTLAQLHWYKIISPNFAAAIDYALTTDLSGAEPGKYEIDGDNAFAILNEYITKTIDECEAESHQDYADIQIMIDGTERFGYAPLIGQEPSVPFQLDNDVAFYELPETELSYITLHPGQFILFFPSDIHQPEVLQHQPAPVKKLVIKVKI